MIVSAGVLVVLNVLAVNLAVLSVFWAKSYWPKERDSLWEAKDDSLRRGAVLLLGLMVISGVLAGITFSSF